MRQRPGPPLREAPSSEARRRGAAVGIGIAIGVGALVIAATAVASVISVLVARRVIVPPQEREEDERILAATERTITLAPSADALLPGRYGLWFSRDTGYARVGRVIESSTNAVTRELIGVDFGELESATRGRLSSWFYLHPSELGVPVEDVLIPTPVGEAPAWLVAAEETSSAWAILVHGRAVTRQETIRAIPTLRAAGYTTLSVSYRNDGEAPPSSDGRYALGDAEWQDVDAAIKYAVEHGATDLVIVGYSMGGAITLQTATRSEYAELVRGVVLDSPVIDWRNVIDAQGAALHIPGLVRDGAVGLIGGSWAGRVTGLDEPVDFARLDFVKRAADLIGPILILASDDDDYVPPGPAKSLAAARPDIVTLELFEGAGHVRLWNYDEERWTGVVSRWIAALPSAAR